MKLSLQQLRNLPRGFAYCTWIGFVWLAMNRSEMIRARSRIFRLHRRRRIPAVAGQLLASQEGLLSAYRPSLLLGSIKMGKSDGDGETVEHRWTDVTWERCGRVCQFREGLVLAWRYSVLWSRRPWSCRCHKLQLVPSICGIRSFQLTGRDMLDYMLLLRMRKSTSSSAWTW